jgi:hypothetical protein
MHQRLDNAKGGIDAGGGGRLVDVGLKVVAVAWKWITPALVPSLASVSSML